MENEKPLAVEIIAYLKKIIIILAITNIITIIGFIVYLCIPVENEEVTKTQTIENISDSSISQNIGGDEIGNSDTNGDN